MRPSPLLASAGLALLLAGGVAVGFAGETPSGAGMPPAGMPPAGASPRSESYAIDTYRSMLARARGAVAVARRRDHVTYASGVLVARDRVLTCRHVTHVHNASVERRSPESLEVVLEGDLSSPPRRFPVVAYAHTSEAFDLCVLSLGPDADGAWPEADRVLTLDAGRVALGDPVYVVHHPHGGPLAIADDARVLFPYEATAAELAAMLERLATEAAPGAAARATSALRGSYREGPVGFLRNLSLRWAGQPVLGADCATVAGSSGAPVFHKRTHALLGILFAGTGAARTADGTTWEHHEAILPAAAILEDLRGSADATCRRLATASPP